MHKSVPTIWELARYEGAVALLRVTRTFLRQNKIPAELRLTPSGPSRLSDRKKETRAYKRLMHAYEEMGIVMTAWFTLPEFLDDEGRPVPLSAKKGEHSIQSLVRRTAVDISAKLAIEFMRRSPSVSVDSRGYFSAIKRVFLLPEFEIPRAALVIGRYLETLRSNSLAHRTGITPVLERNCYVPAIETKYIARILRDIKDRGTAFMDSVDGDIESRRVPAGKSKNVSELGVLTFVWARAPNARGKMRPQTGIRNRRSKVRQN